MVKTRPLIAHVIHHLAIGGLENGLVNLVNHMPAQRYRHMIVCMVGFSEFRERIRRDDVDVVAIRKRAGKDPKAQLRLYRLFRQVRPDILHTRNLAALDALLPGALAGVRCRIHGEHGRDLADVDGSSRRLRYLRRLHRPLIHHYIAVSRDLADYLNTRIGVPESRISQIHNGVDTGLFQPRRDGREAGAMPVSFARRDCVVVGTVGRMDEVKDPLNLVDAFVLMLQRAPALRATLRLVLAGDGPLRGAAKARAAEAGIADLCWMPGERHDVPAVMRGLDVFVLPSLAEGMSNTILEAMACGIPVVATAVGGSGELVVDGQTGSLVPPASSAALAAAIARYVSKQGLRAGHGAAGRARAVSHFDLSAMVQRYLEVYDRLMFPAPRAGGS